MDLDTIVSLTSLDAALEAGLDTQWRTLAKVAANGSFFQDLPWCVSWYKAYSAFASPRLFLLRDAGRLVGVAALAASTSDGTLIWAGSSMSDYRDVLATEEAREALILCVLRHFAESGYRSPFQWGYTQPDSRSVTLVERHASSLGLRVRAHAHPCYRLMFREKGASARLAKKESVRRHLAFYRKQGAISCIRIQDAATWERYRTPFFIQHTLRQVFAGRPPSFFNTAKQALYDDLFRDYPEHIALHVLQVGERVVAAHVGFLWERLAYFGAPSIDVIDQRRSPGQVLLALMAKDLDEAGFLGIDLTIGESTYKQRFGNDLVSLPSCEIHAAGPGWWFSVARHALITLVKGEVVRRRGALGWTNVRDRFRRVATSLPAMARRRSFLSELVAATNNSPGRRYAISKRDTWPHADLNAEFALTSASWNDLSGILEWNAAPELRTRVLRALVHELEKGARLLVVRIADRVVGWLLLQIDQGSGDQRHATAYALCILDRSQKKRILALLCREAVAEARRLSAQETELVVFGYETSARLLKQVLGAIADVPR